VGRPPEACRSSGGGASFCMRDIFVLNEIRAQDDIYRHSAELKYIICHLLSTGTGSEL
jgi:hypothetical protein